MKDLSLASPKVFTGLKELDNGSVSTGLAMDLFLRGSLTAFGLKV